MYQKLKIKNTKLKSENNFKNENFKNLSKILKLKRMDNENLSNIFNDYVINKIFKTKIGEVNSIETSTGIFTFKILKEHSVIKIDVKDLEQIDNNFKENMLSDIQSFYYKSFETFHKVKTDLKSLDNLVNFNQ